MGYVLTFIAGVVVGLVLACVSMALGRILSEFDK
jgi:MFS superfamily sulfate permease-like transporter